MQPLPLTPTDRPASLRRLCRTKFD